MLTYLLCLRSRACVTALLCGTLLTVSGCRRPVEIDPQVDHMKPISVLYGRYKSQNRGRPPKNEADFKKFIDSQGKDLLTAFGIESADVLLVSPRDKQPFVITYGNGKGPASGIVAYEKQGLNGKRWTADDLGKVEELDETSLRQLVPNY